MLLLFVILALAAVVCVPLFRRAKLSAVLGYLAAGMLVGPHGLAFAKDPGLVLSVAEFGVVLLLFLVGLELEPRRLWTLRQQVFGLGGLQVLLSTVVLTPLVHAFGPGWRMAGLTGFALAMSSTAFVLQMLGERDELKSPHGRAAFAILLFQDLSVIPVLALLPLLSGEEKSISLAAFGPAALKAFGVIGAVLVIGHYAMRPILRLLANTRTPEMLTVGALLIVTATALAMEEAGLSMALGAFTAGILLSDSEYRHELEANIEPFKGLLLGAFFIGVGMSANLTLLFSDAGVVLGLTLGLLVAKSLVLYGLGRLMKLPHRSSAKLAAAMALGGEFAFVILTQLDGVLSGQWHERLILVVTLSMAATPLSYGVVGRLVGRHEEQASFDVIDVPENDIIIAGFGPFGQIVGRLLRVLGRNFTVLDRDAQHVDFLRRFGTSLFYSDASRVEALRAAKADAAKMFVIAIADEEQSLKIIRTVTHNFPHLKVYACARTRQHALQLTEAGAHRVIRRSLYSSLEMSHDLLLDLGMAPAAADRAVALFRQQDAKALARQQAVWGDDDRMRQTARETAEELEQLFAEDQWLGAKSPSKPRDKNGPDGRPAPARVFAPQAQRRAPAVPDDQRARQGQQQ